MKTCFSWLKKTFEDADRLSSVASVAVCAALFAGTLAFATEKSEAKTHEAEAARENVPARIVLRFENFVPAMPEGPAETENAPTETAPQTPENPKPETPEEPPPEKTDESALRETVPEEPPEKEIEEPEQIEKQQTVPVAPVLEHVPEIDSAAQIAAQETLYGALAEAVSRKKFYPKAARRNGRTGTVFVRVSIGVCGKITSYEIAEKSSAHKLLVSGAEETLRRVAENFCAPAETRAALPAELVLPVRYELK